MYEAKGPLPGKFRQTSPILLSAILISLLGLPAQASVLVEGKVKGFTTDGPYDLEFEVRNLSKPTASRIIKLTIRLSKVAVSDSRFKIRLEAGMEDASVSKISLSGRARPDDSQAGFIPVEVTAISVPSPVAMNAAPRQTLSAN